MEQKLIITIMHGQQHITIISAFSFMHCPPGGPDRVVVIAPGYGLDGPGIESR